MDAKNRVLVFDKKEVILVFVFMILVAIIAFASGVKTGKLFAYSHMGVEKEDLKTVELRSSDEESVSHVVAEYEKNRQEIKKQVDEDIDQRLKEELSVIDHEAKVAAASESAPSAKDPLLATQDLPPSSGHPGAGPSVAVAPTAMERAPASLPPESEPALSSSGVAPIPMPEMKLEAADGVASKYTIQLGSYQAKIDAIKFADGFRVRGYNPIISEVQISGKGIWYRVSLGVFNSIIEAKEYIQKEESLFQGQDYIISAFE